MITPMRRAAVLLLVAALAACASAPATDSPTARSTATPASQSAAEAAYLAAVVALPDALGPDVHAYNTTCSNTLTTPACVQALTMFGSDMDGFLTAIAALPVPTRFGPGDTALRKALADLTGTIATLITAITAKGQGIEQDADGAVSAEGEIFPALGIIAKEQATVPASAFTPADATFSTQLPAGWSNVTGEAALLATHHLTGAELVAMHWEYLGATQGIAVAYTSVQLVTPPLAATRIAAYLKTLVPGVTLLIQPAAFTVDATSGLYDTTSATSAGNDYAAQDMVINHGGRTFEIVLTVLRSVFPAVLPGFNDLMNAWRWGAG
jgi:hypothetical protein